MDCLHTASLLGLSVALYGPWLASQTPILAAQPSPTATAEPSAPPHRPYDLVVIVSFDGMRPDGMDRADAPTLHRLRAEGADALAAVTVPDSSTLPAHASMLSGTDVAAHGMDFDDYRPDRGFIHVPTVFYRAHDAGMATAMFVSKTKLRHIALPGSLDLWSLPHWSCERVSTAAAAYLANAPPGIVFIHFEEPDDAGHRHHWMSHAYLSAIARTDRCFATVMSAIEHRPDAPRTLVIATSDHGGHGRRHGSHSPLDLHIPWLAWGTHVQRGDFTETVHTTDTAATALAALGLAVPTDLSGHPVTRALAGP